MSNSEKKRIPSSGLPDGLHLDTLAVREGLPRSQWGENSEALFVTSSFVQPDAATAARRFAEEEEAFTYGRFGNPTVMMMERRLAALEGTSGCIGTGSGMSANLLLLMGLLQKGDHVLCSRSMFGSTLRLIQGDMGKFGIESTTVSQTDLDEWRAAMRPNTKLLIAESPSNPLTDLCDIAALADIAHRAGAQLAMDNSFCSPALQQPVNFGADFVIHSGTKYLDGQGRVIAGALCGPDELLKAKMYPVMKSAGLTLSPFNAWVVLKGMETLSVRMQAQSQRALQIAHWLSEQAQVARVHYPGLASHPQHALAMAQQGGSGGAVVAFDVKGQGEHDLRARAFRVIDAAQVASITTNLGDVKSTICHPATTSHGRLTEAQRQAAGIGQGLIRFAVGLEDVDDLKVDLLRGLSQL
ncbi:MAG: O-succinylhomoserine sulfhydrylase [Ideonella sp.]|nr:O-succinylhomoserine sulfhydrylase [Ideonella sp.]